MGRWNEVIHVCILDGEGEGGGVSINLVCNFRGRKREEGVDHGRSGIASVHHIF